MNDLKTLYEINSLRTGSTPDPVLKRYLEVAGQLRAFNHDYWENNPEKNQIVFEKAKKLSETRLLEDDLEITKRSVCEFKLKLAWMYRDGRGVSKDISLAEQTMRDSYNMGYQNAGRELMILLMNSNDVSKQKEAFELSSSLSKKGDGVAKAYLSYMLREGIGTDVNKDASSKILRELEKCNSSLALRNIMNALSLTDDEGRRTTFRIKKKMAIQGNLYEQYGLYYLYRYGYGTAVNNDEAKKWLVKTFKNNNNITYRKISYPFLINYLLEDNSKNNYSTDAFTICLTMAKKGYVDCQTILSKMYRNGVGTPVSLEQSMIWARISGFKLDSYKMIENVLFNNEKSELNTLFSTISDNDIISTHELLGLAKKSSVNLFGGRYVNEDYYTTIVSKYIDVQFKECGNIDYKQLSEMTFPFNSEIVNKKLRFWSDYQDYLELPRNYSYDTINIAVICSKGYLQYANVLFKSILQNNNSASFYIISTDEISEQDMVIMNWIDPANLHLIKYDSNIIDGYFDPRWPKSITAELILPSLLPTEVDRVLYLEVDTIVNKPLDDLYSLDMTGKYMAACFVESYTVNLLQHQNMYAGINAGVVLFNLKQMREDGIDVNTYKDGIQYLTCPYQQEIVLDRFHSSKTIFLPSFMYNCSYILKQIISNANIMEPEPIIIHYSGYHRIVTKPWHVLFVDEDHGDAIDIKKCNIPEELLSLVKIWWHYASMCDNYSQLKKDIKAMIKTT